MAVKAFDQIAPNKPAPSPEGVGSFEDIKETTTSDLFSRGYLTSVDQEIKDADTDFDIAKETRIPMSELQAFGRYKGPRKRPMLGYASRLGARFSDQLFNRVISSTVRNLTDSDASAASVRAVELIDEYEKEKGIKFTDVLWEDQLADWTRQLYEKPEARESDFLKGERQWPVPEKFASYFDPREIDKAEGWAETAVDSVSGIIGFVAQLAAFKKAFPGVPEPLAWEAVSIANGGTPGSGSAMYGAMGLVGSFFPATKPVSAKLGGGLGVGAIYGTTTALAGGTTEEIVIHSGLPVLLSAMRIKKSEWNALKQKSKLNLIRNAKEIVPGLKPVSSKEIDAAITKSLIEAEIVGIKNLGKKPAQKTVVTKKPLKPVDVTGKRVTSKHAKRLEERAILEGLIGKEGIENLASHVVAKRAKQAKQANEIPPSDALKMILGEKAYPTNTLESAVYIAVKNRAMAQNDVTTLTALAQSNRFTEATSRHAQELQALANEMKYSPVELSRDVIKARGVIPDKKLGKKLRSAEKKLNKTQEKLSKKEIDLTIAEVSKKISARRVNIKAKSYGVKNRFVTKKMADAAWKRLGERKLFAGIDPARFLDVLEISTYHLEAIGRNLPAWSKAMVDQFGEKIKPHLKDLWKKANDKLSVTAKTGLSRKLDLAFEKHGTILDQTKIIQQLQESLIRGGLKTRKPLLDAMHKILIEIDPLITRRETMDAMSGSGRYKLLNKDEIKTIRRDLNNQYQQVAKLQDMAAGKAPPATGFERQPPSTEGRKLLKQVNEAKKKGGFESVSPERELKSALASIKTRLNNRITDLKEQLKTGKKLIKTKKAQPSDAETVRLTNEKNMLQKQFDEMFGPKQISPEQRAKMAVKAVEKSIAELDRKIKTGDISPAKRGTKTPQTPELVALRSRRDALSEELKLMRDMAKPKKTPEELALQSYKTRLANERAKYDEMIATENFAKPTRAEKKLDAEATKLLAERDSASRTVRIAREIMDRKGGIAHDEVQRINDLSKSIDRTKLALEADPKNKQLHIDHGNAILDFEEYADVLVPKPNTWRNLALDVAGTPRTLMTSIDLSFPFRQGWGSMGTKEFWQAFGEQFKYAWSEKNLRTLMAEIKGSPRFAMAKASGLRMTDLGEILKFREEGMQSTMADRIPIVGRYVRGSQRAYTGMANYIRWNRFNNMVDAAVLQGKSLKGVEGLKLTTDIANVINVFTGSGNLGPMDAYGNASPAVNQFLFSARKLSADITMPFKPLNYVTLSPFARKMAQRQILGSLAMTSSILGLASMSGLDVELNPTSPNFGTIIVGDRRVDLTGGKAALFVFTVKGFTSVAKRSDGDFEEITPYEKERMIQRFSRGKLAPMVSLYADIFYFHQDYMGDPVETPTEITKAVASRFYPMAIADTIDLIENSDDGDIAAEALIDLSFAMAAMFGASVRVNKKKKPGIVNF